MGQREPWRAQLATWSMVVLGGEGGVSGWMEDMGVDDRVGLDNEVRGTHNAYWRTPFLPSWLGRGTSRRSFLTIPIGGGGGGLPATSLGFWTVVADFEAELEMDADGQARMTDRGIEDLAN
jgi:hypothetical protein